MELYAHEVKVVIALLQRVKADSLKSSFDYFNRPQAFVRECFKWAPGRGICGYQGETLDALQRYRRHAICGPHGTRKTSTEAMAALWFVITREVAGVPWKVLVTAGAWGQLRDYFWPEVHLWAGRLDWSKIPLAPFSSDQLLDFAIKLRHGRAISKASKSFQEGAHSENVLFIADEAKSIPARAFDAAEGALSVGNCFALVGSTPEDPEGRFYEIMTGADGFQHWNARFIGKNEVLAAGAMNPEWDERMRQSYGEHSKIYLNRVEGKFSEAGSDSIFQLSWIRRANELYRIWKERGGQLTRLTSLGCDIASGGQDSTINALRQSGIQSVDVDGTEITIDVTEFEPQTSDTMQATGSLARQLKANPGASATLDVIGVGVGAGDRARELGLNVIPFYSNARTSARDAATGTIEFMDKRSWLIWEFARRLKPENGFNLAFPDFKQEGGMSLTAQLQTLTYAEESNGKIKVRSKRSTRNDLKGQSTNEADAIFYAHNPEADGIFKAHWWRYWMPRGLKLDPVEVIGPTGEAQLVECVELPEQFDAMIVAWHLAYKDDDSMKKPAFVVGQAQAFKGGDCFIVDQFRARQDFPSACASMNTLSKNWPGCFAKLVDVTQNGQAVIASMRRQVSGIRAVTPKDLLIPRANAVGVTVYSGHVYLPHPQAANWVSGLIQEAAEFPNGANQEQVSALVLGIGSVRKLAGQKQTEFIL
jgi:phage terminase large subunit-like protein